MKGTKAGANEGFNVAGLYLVFQNGACKFDQIVKSTETTFQD